MNTIERIQKFFGFNPPEADVLPDKPTQAEILAAGADAIMDDPEHEDDRRFMPRTEICVRGTRPLPSNMEFVRVGDPNDPHRKVKWHLVKKESTPEPFLHQSLQEFPLKDRRCLSDRGDADDHAD